MTRAATTLVDPCTGAPRRDFLLGLHRGQLVRAHVPSWCSGHRWTLVAPNALALSGDKRHTQRTAHTTRYRTPIPDHGGVHQNGSGGPPGPLRLPANTNARPSPGATHQ